MLPPSAMPPGSISMTMKAPGVGTAQGYSVFDGKLVNRGWLVLRLKMSGAEKSTVVRFIYSFLFNPAFITPFLKSVAFHNCFVFVNYCCLYALRILFCWTKVNWLSCFHAKIKQQKDKKWCAAVSDNNNKDDELQLFQVCLTVVEMKVCHPHWSWENKAIKPREGELPKLSPPALKQHNVVITVT